MIAAAAKGVKARTCVRIRGSGRGEKVLSPAGPSALIAGRRARPKTLIMDIPRFHEHIRKAADPGEAFQEFVHELLLPDHPGLHFFQRAGRTGPLILSAWRTGRASSSNANTSARTA